MSKPKKKRSSKYDPKLAINGSFAEVIKVSVKEDKSKEQPKKKAKKKK